ncbi:DUF397 domain-containing protein [Streptomyces sp. enrichment culture]|uniref:DUF397 domain-containing protein n=1 Tax=Streptomyces sp. enrichment culture TaxID=1795815 RepID=UPI003F54356D
MTDLNWFKSSYSSSSDIESCVEVAVAATPATIHIRDSKHTDGPLLTLTPSAWSDFVRHAAQG